jgi:alcohol dehydrogenase class IV
MEPFTWHDGPRTIRFGRGTAATLRELTGDGIVVLNTERALAQYPAIADGAMATLFVASTSVDEAAAWLLDAVRETPANTLVAFGGGRVIDVTKALGAALGRTVAAVPTTLSAAEMTGLHRAVKGVWPAPPPVRPQIVLNDPVLSASQPPAELAASAANALAHAIEAAVSTKTSPVPAYAAREAARLIAVGDRDALALGALLAGYAMDAASFGLHHVLAQTLRATGRVWHGHANAALLPHTHQALAQRGLNPPASAELARRLARDAGVTHLADHGVDEALLDDCAVAAAARPELDHTPVRATVDEIRALYRAAL